MKTLRSRQGWISALRIALATPCHRLHQFLGQVFLRRATCKVEVWPMEKMVYEAVRRAYEAQGLSFDSDIRVIQVPVDQKACQGEGEFLLYADGQTIDKFLVIQKPQNESETE